MVGILLKQKAKRKQHAQLYRKALLRKALLTQALPGDAYVPFIKNGDLARLYADTHVIYGADPDQACVRKAQRKIPNALIVRADCSTFPFSDCGGVFSVADFDTHDDPYRSFEAFWKSNALRANRVVVFFRDDRRGYLLRFKTIRYPDDTKEQIWDAERLLRVHHSYLEGIVFPWLAQLISPWRLTTEKHFFQGAMTYWGGVLERG